MSKLCVPPSGHWSVVAANVPMRQMKGEREHPECGLGFTLLNLRGVQGDSLKLFFQVNL